MANTQVKTAWAEQRPRATETQPSRLIEFGLCACS
jgi:hypothetical protein